MRSNNFDRVAFVYDGLVRLIFGRALKDAQKYFLNIIKPGNTVLILGGGTGWILEELHVPCEVCYVDASTKMIERASRRDVMSKVHFIAGTEDDIPDRKYDVIIANFYFDLFTTEKVKDAIELIRKSTHEESRWIVTDFVETDVWWQRMLLKAMYFFFRITCNIESSHLPDWNSAFSDIELKMRESKMFYSGFIGTSVWNH